MKNPQTLPRKISHKEAAELAQNIKNWGNELGFQQTGITDTNLSHAEEKLLAWIAAGYVGEMAWMAQHGRKRSHPDELVAGTTRIISVRMDYQHSKFSNAESVLTNPKLGYVSRYALGRDYHKLMRKRLQKLADKIQHEIGDFAYRVFVDSAPVLEKPIAQKAGLGWVGKHSNILNRDAGSWFFLGEIYTNLPLPTDTVTSDHCGDCVACIDACPTQAIVKPYEVDARRCISYLTIELKGSIPLEFRKAMGNRIYGCDDCQIYCPWNRFANDTQETEFYPRHQLNAPLLLELFNWDEQTFMNNMEGSAIRRIGYESWLRNIAIAIGNAPTSEVVITTLKQREHDNSEIVREHVRWALEQHNS